MAVGQMKTKIPIGILKEAQSSQVKRKLSQAKIDVHILPALLVAPVVLVAPAVPVDPAASVDPVVPVDPVVLVFPAVLFL
uniref:Uncharacterized protein n=1 Tax=Strongyloides stercoralis TaxID=6248 RepID=A0A0K0EKX6_STRER